MALNPETAANGPLLHDLKTALLRWLVKKKPGVAELRHALGTRLAPTDPAEAETHLLYAIFLDRKARASYCALVSLYLNQPDRLADAELAVERMHEVFPDDPIVHVHYGMVLEQKGCNAEAEAAYKKAAELGPTLSWPHDLLGRLRYKLDDPDGAEATCRRAVELEPKIWGNHFNLGVVLSGRGRKDEAVDCFRKVIKLEPRNAAAHINLGFLLLETGRKADAVRTARRAIGLEPKTAAQEFHLGNLLRELDCVPEAEAALRRAIARDPEEADALNNLGLLLTRPLGRTDEAEQLLRRGLAIQPDDRNLNLNLALVLRMKMCDVEARPFLLKGLRSDPDNYDTLVGLAAVEQSLGNIAAYQEYASKARSLMPAEEHYAAACLEAVCSNHDLALQHLLSAAKQNGFDGAWAWRDPDLCSLRDDPRFTEIVGPQSKQLR